MRKWLLVIGVVFLVGCLDTTEAPRSAPRSTSGAQKVSVKVKKGPDGLTSEQRNIAEKLQDDNEPGAIKHLYVISAYSGQVILYSTVREKVTSSGKRLTPNTVAAGMTRTSQSSYKRYGIPVNIGGTRQYTTEVLQDDGTYGSSIPYLMWWDTAGRSHKHYVAGGQIIHISDQPLPGIKSITINLSTGNQ